MVPADLANLENPGYVYFEKGYGEVLGISDEEFEAKGCHVCSREEILKKDIVCDPKIGDADYLNELITGDIGKVLKDSLIIENGVILDDEINKFQNR